MSKRFLLVVIGSVLIGCSSVEKKPQASGGEAAAIERLSSLGLHFKLHRKTLSNGLKVLVVEDRSVPLVAYQTWVNVGSVHETFGLTGMAHLFEHLMFKDSAKFGQRAFFNLLEAKGANVNAFTTRDYTVFHQVFGTHLLQTAIDLESDRLANLKIDEDTMNMEKQVVFEERRLRTENSPDGRMQEAMWSLIFRSHPYRWPVIGYEEDLRRMELADLERFFREHYHPGNVAVVVVGDVQAKDVFSRIETAYGGLRRGVRKQTSIPDEPEQKEGRRVVLKDDVASEKLIVAYRSTPASHEDTHALDVLSNILFAGASSRGYQALVEREEIALNVGGFNYTPLHPGVFMVSATLKSGKTADEFETGLEALFEDVRTNGVSEEEIQTAIRQLTMQIVDNVRTAQGLANLIGTVNAIFGDPMRFQEDLARYSKVRREDVLRVARRYLKPSRKNVVRLIPGGRE